MPIVRIEEWRPGFKKVEHTRVLRATTGMSLADAKWATDRVLNGGSVDVAVLDADVATQLTRNLNKLGAKAIVVSADDTT
jgi:hypothetical protein